VKRRAGRPLKPRVAGSSGAALTAARERTGLTQSALSVAAGLSGHQIWLYEAGRSRPRHAAAERVAAAVGLTVADIWPPLARAVRRGRLLETVIPFEQAAKTAAVRERFRLRVAYSDPDGGTLVRHEHRPPLCCGCAWCRIVDLSDPETYRVVAEPTRISAGGVNG